MGERALSFNESRERRQYDYMLKASVVCLVISLLMFFVFLFDTSECSETTCSGADVTWFVGLFVLCVLSVLTFVFSFINLRFYGANTFGIVTISSSWLIFLGVLGFLEFLVIRGLE